MSTAAGRRLKSERGPEVHFKMELPDLYPDQLQAFETLADEQYAILRCGRRYGKTTYGGEWAIGGANYGGLASGQNVGWFAPSYKIMAEVYYELSQMLEPIKLHASKTDGVIRTVTGGRIDFWTLENLDAGRSRKYHRIVIDEGAFTNDETMMDQWEKAIEPTLADYNGSVLVCSNTNGVNPNNFLYRISPGGADTPGPDGRGSKFHFREYHAPSSRNPFLSKQFLENKKANSHPLVWRQEYLAEFVDWSGVAFFSLDKLLVNNKPVPRPPRVDGVFAVIDTAVKTGKDNNGTAVTFWGLINNVPAPLVILDWDILQIEGSLLETWLPTVFQRLEELARVCKARNGSLGVHIEDKSTGMVLLQQALKRGWPAHPINGKLTGMGKDERCINVSGDVYNGKIKLSQEAYDKVMVYKDVSQNHLVSQVTGFRVGDKKAATRADDLLDTFCYGIAIAIGNPDLW
jgi:hypothetical protein